jgi:hypothetical protein
MENEGDFLCFYKTLLKSKNQKKEIGMITAQICGWHLGILQANKAMIFYYGKLFLMYTTITILS